tara:strand:+ start:163 stop:576 length:414 start_codon:yes stop_codon:yes gene_type:complete
MKTRIYIKAQEAEILTTRCQNFLTLGTSGIGWDWKLGNANLLNDVWSGLFHQLNNVRGSLQREAYYLLEMQIDVENFHATQQIQALLTQHVAVTNLINKIGLKLGWFSNEEILETNIVGIVGTDMANSSFTFEGLVK